MHPIVGISLCALHSGLGRTKWNIDFGSAKTLAEFKKTHTVKSGAA